VLLPRRLRTKLTVLYAGLFCAALLLIGAIAYTIIASNAQRLVREQLAATGVVFDRVWELRFEQLREGSRLASRDYGFREAVASNDVATIGSALANLRGRLHADLIYLLTPDGLLIDPDGAAETASPGLEAILNDNDEPAGVLIAHGALFQTVAMPVFAPHMLGWIVVGARLDETEMRALEQLSALPLHAEAVVGRTTRHAAWMEEALAAGEPRIFTEDNAAALVLVKPLHSLDGARAALILRYPLASALAPYRALFNSLVAIGIAMLGLLLAGSWVLAKGITRPLSILAEAAQKLRQGLYEPVQIDTQDEIAHLADSFNTMIETLRDRERKIMHLAFHDGETGLPNRVALERRLSAAAPDGVFLAAVGIDRFAQIRAAIGYAHTEALVRRLGARLARLIPGSLTARLSSDVLAVAFKASNQADAQRRSRALIAHLERPVSLDGQAIDVSVTIGCAPPRTKDDAPAVHIKRASIALDQARGAHNKIATFDEAAYGNPAHNLSLMGEMRRALDNGAVFLVHQPKYSFPTNRVDSAETLVRWRHPMRGLIAPDLFVPMAEETGHIRALTDWVLRKAIEEQQMLASAGWPLTFAVNISGRLLGDQDFAQTALELAMGAKHSLCFEITETAIIDNPAAALKNIERFAEHGVRIAIDDYGSGLSSLAYLRQLPVNELKIDRMFVQNITNNQRDALLVRSTVELAHGLGMEVTAEGVEQPAAFALLAAMGCDTAQGYAIARPTPLSDLAAVLSNIEPVSALKKEQGSRSATRAG
jgi:EAL domain-containing protein (putative c-di-GMP-specific phosphodiesterase class I)/GGDEF domain-containing protein